MTEIKIKTTLKVNSAKHSSSFKDIKELAFWVNRSKKTNVSNKIHKRTPDL